MMQAQQILKSPYHFKNAALSSALIKLIRYKICTTSFASSFNDFNNITNIFKFITLRYLIQ